MVEQAAGVPLHNRHPRRPRPAQLLLVDDDAALLEALAGTLQSRLGHFALDTCETGMKALDRVTAKHYDTIIADMNLPDMQGIEFLRRVRQLQPVASVVMISGDADPAMASDAIVAGAADFMAKPIERTAFIFTVRQTLNISRLRARLERQRTLISRAHDHYVSIVQKVGQSNERWLAGSLDSILKAHSGVVPHDALIRQQNAEKQINIFTERATRHLAILDGFLFDATKAHHQTAEKFNRAQDDLRRLALTRLQGS